MSKYTPKYTMNPQFKDKLIQLVKTNDCIYNTKHEEYKNIKYKALLWEKIGASLGMDGGKAKEQWRLLRDGYVRHRKSVKGHTGASRKYLHYTWSAQMGFLDGTASDPLDTSATSPQRSPSPAPPQSLLEQPGHTLYYQEQEEDGSSSPLNTPEVTSYMPIVSLQSLPTVSIQKRKREGSSSEEECDRMINYLRKEKKDLDGIDYLFISYSKSFRDLSAWNQAKLKVELAKLFADADLCENKNKKSANNSSQTNSVESEHTTQSLLVKEESGK